MTDLMTALRAKYRSPQAALRALGLDEALLREGKPMKNDAAQEKAAKAGLKSLLAEDASLEDVMKFIDALNGANKANAAEAAPPDEYEDDAPDAEEGETPDNEEEMDLEPNAGAPEGLKKAEDEDMDGMADVGTDNEGGDNGKIRECLKMLQDLGAGGEEKPTIDEEPGKEEPKEEEKKDMKAAMDAAIKAERDNSRAIRDAEREVRPVVGELTLAFDSADEVYRHALKAIGTEGVDKIRDSAALQVLWKSIPKPGANAPRKLAMDADASKDYAARFPNANRLKRA